MQTACARPMCGKGQAACPHLLRGEEHEAEVGGQRAHGLHALAQGTRRQAGGEPGVCASCICAAKKCARVRLASLFRTTRLTSTVGSTRTVPAALRPCATANITPHTPLLRTVCLPSTARSTSTLHATATVPSALCATTNVSRALVVHMVHRCYLSFGAGLASQDTHGHRAGVENAPHPIHTQHWPGDGTRTRTFIHVH